MRDDNSSRAKITTLLESPAERVNLWHLKIREWGLLRWPEHLDCLDVRVRWGLDMSGSSWGPGNINLEPESRVSV